MPACGHAVTNTHPFTMDGRIFAHNGTLGSLESLDQHLFDLGAAGLVLGDTDNVLERSATSAPLAVATPRIRALSPDLTAQPAVIIASEPMDGETRWRLMDSGELLHVARDLTITRTRPFPRAPKHLLTLADLSPTAAASQAPAAQRDTGPR